MSQWINALAAVLVLAACLAGDSTRITAQSAQASTNASSSKARGMTEVQVHAIGPFQLTYVHPSDDSTKK